MVVSLKAHFDGKVIVPDEPVDLPIHQLFDVQINLAPRSVTGVPGSSLLDLAGTLSAEEAEQMLKLIEEDCRRVEPDEW